MRKMIVLLVFSAIWPLSAAEKVTWHDDRPTPKHIYQPMGGETGEQSEASALAYLAAHKDRFMLEPGDLVFSHVKTSLLGKHFYFDQYLEGVRVQDAQIVVSIDDKGDISRLSNNVYPASTPSRKSKYILDPDEALDMAWNHLKVHGRLVTVPKCDKVYIPKDGDFILAYETTIHTEAPMGSWKVAVDAIDGSIISSYDSNLYRKHVEREDYSRYEGSLANRQVETAEVAGRMKKLTEESTASKKVDGSGYTFDPDPRTTLADASLQDQSDPSVFTNAYFNVPLRDLTVSQSTGNYSLRGPWCEITDVSSPFTAASTTTDGVWTATRGDNAFNDTMTYYHIDKSQRYLQSLGFTGAKGIQERRLPVDTDALGGQDQSVFSSDMNGLQFGHGCVDDNEDADVILHEYGHAMQYSIDPNFLTGRGDHGGMGEGFGDYWAASYSLTTQNGRTFNPEWIFTWDGHGDPVDCWSGRVANITASYDRSRSYGAHQTVNGVNADEMWSSPLFLAAQYLLNRGIPLSESDRIILEGHFGLTGALKMPDMAQSIVDAARRLYPDGPHGDAFQQAFARNNILEPIAAFTYYSAHVPPSRSAVDWQSEIQITNPGQSTANVTATVYENTGSGFTAHAATSLSIDSGQTASFVPTGTEQRWVRFDSDTPLSGAFFFSRDPQSDKGTEKAGIPLFAQTETAASLIFPHVPADRPSFWSGAVLVNPSSDTLNLTIELVGDAGSDLSHLLTGAARTSLGPFEKWVTFLAEGPGGLTGLFDDSDSSEKVSWVRVSAGGDLAGFQLYGYNADTSEIATAGIMALPDQARTVWPLRVSLAGVEWSAFSVLNPSSDAQPVEVTVLGRDGAVLSTATMTILPRSKVLGLNLGSSGFSFPSDGSGIVIPDGANVQMVTLKSDGALRAFELAGDFSNRMLDGAAVTGVTSQVAFNNPKGVFELTQVDLAGTVTVTVYRGSDVASDSQALAQGETISSAIDPSITAIEVSGTGFSAAIIDSDSEARTLTIVNGKQVEPTP